MRTREWIACLVGAVLLAALALWARGHVHFQWSVFVGQIRHIRWECIAIAVVMVGSSYWLRAARWALLIRKQKRVGSSSLLGPQVIGFTAVALFGRLADLVRPYLVARRTSLIFSSQVAVYTLERTFDLAATACLFAAALLFAPDRATLPHRAAFERTAIVAIAGTVSLALFALAVRFFGKKVARSAAWGFGMLSRNLGHSVELKILSFREGLIAIESGRDFLRISVLSLVMWMAIAASYLETARAFTLSPELSSLSLARCLVLMAASMAGSAVQLPIVGWFTQIAVTTGVMEALFHVRFEPALGCSAMLLIVGFLWIVPIGIVWARVDRLSLKTISMESEQLAAAPADKASAEPPTARAV